jgi:hypothetical protein
VVRPSVALGLFEYGKTPGVGGQSGKTCSVGRDGLIERLTLSLCLFPGFFQLHVQGRALYTSSIG